jgi:hypothetical protein
MNLILIVLILLLLLGGGGGYYYGGPAVGGGLGGLILVILVVWLFFGRRNWFLQRWSSVAADASSAVSRAYSSPFFLALALISDAGRRFARAEGFSEIHRTEVDQLKLFYVRVGENVRIWRVNAMLAEAQARFLNTCGKCRKISRSLTFFSGPERRSIA